MFYRLNNRYRLTGWQNLPTGIVDTENDSAFFLPREEYSLLLHMNGREEMNPDMFTPEQQKSIRRFLDQGLISAGDCAFPDAISPIYHFYNHFRKESVQWSITGNCNYRCRHCLLSAPENRSEDLTTKQCFDIIRQIADCGIHKVSLTGGEPLLRKDLPELIRAFTDAGIKITEIQTNGSLLIPQKLDLFTSLGQHPVVHVSYDGIGWHDWVRGMEGAQLAAEKALLAAHEAGLETLAAMCLFRDNVPAIRETVLHLVSLGVGTVKLSPMLEIGLWGDYYSEKTLTDEQFLQAALEYIPSFVADGKPCELMFGGYFNYIKKKDFFTSLQAKDEKTPAPLYACPWAANNLYISQTGKVLPCMEFAGLPGYEEFPDITKAPLSEILRDSVYIRTVRTRTDEICSRNNECMQCPEREKHCGQTCRASAKHDYCGIDRNTCNFVRNNWFEKVREVVEKTGCKYSLL